MTDYLKSMKSIGKHKNPWKNFRLPTEQEKKARLSDRIANYVLADNHMDRIIKRKVI